MKKGAHGALFQFDPGRFRRSERARDELKNNAFIQKVRVIVNSHRERARSYTGIALVGGCR